MYKQELENKLAKEQCVYNINKNRHQTALTWPIVGQCLCQLQFLNFAYRKSGFMWFALGDAAEIMGIRNTSDYIVFFNI